MSIFDRLKNTGPAGPGQQFQAFQIQAEVMNQGFIQFMREKVAEVEARIAARRAASATPAMEVESLDLDWEVEED